MQVDVLGLDHEGKASRTGEDSPEDVNGQEETKQQLRGVSEETIDLAASPGSSIPCPRMPMSLSTIPGDRWS